MATSCSARPPVQTNFTLEREIRGGEVHVFPVEIERGQFLRVLVEEDGIDLEARLLDPNEIFLAGADSPGTRRRIEVTEDLSALAKETGPHRLEIKASGQGSGRYLLRIEPSRTPSETDKARAAAVQALWTGLHSKQMEDQIQSLEHASTLWRQAGDLEKAAEAYFGLGVKRFHSLKKYDQALADFQEAVRFWSQESTRRSKLFEAESLTYVGRCLTNLGRRDEARSAHEQALSLLERFGQADLQARNLNYLGILHVDDGEAEEGIKLLVPALEIARRDRIKDLEPQVLNHLGFGYEQLGELQKAIDVNQEALRLAIESSDHENATVYRNNLAELYRLLGDWDKALEYYRQVDEMSGYLDDNQLGKILINQATAYRRRGEIEKARESLDRALILGRKVGSREIQVFALGDLAFLLLQLKQPTLAAEHAREAVSLGGEPEQELHSRYALGYALRELGETDAARRELTTALSFAGRRKDRQAEINLVFARMDQESGDLASALSRIRTAIALIESQRDRVIDPELRTSLLSSKQDYYELQVDILMALHAEHPSDGFAAAALRASEQARARGLLDILSEAGADIQSEADPALVEKEHKLRLEVSTLYAHRRRLLAEENPSSEELAETQRKLDEAQQAYQRVQVELRQSSPRYAALTEPQPLDVAEIQRQVLDGKALLLEYSLGTKRSFLWVVTPDSVTSFELPKREEIEESARRYYRLLTERSREIAKEDAAHRRKRFDKADADAESEARELSRLILRPAEKLLGDRTLLIVADGALQYIPFAALPISTTGKLLVSRHVIVNLPSASALAVLRRELDDRPRAARSLAIFADPVFQKDDDRFSQRFGAPDSIGPIAEPTLRGSGEPEARRGKEIDLSSLRRLRFSQMEANAIAALVPAGQVFKAVGFAASKAAVTSSSLENYQNVHFATHGLIDSVDPESSALVLSQYNERGEAANENGLLLLNDIYNLRLNAELVTLSACRTALGKEIRGEGLIGLTRGFMYAGAARVLASLWSVDDRPTAKLMEIFYSSMIRDGLSPAAALREAQSKMSENPSPRPPYFWAGFTLQGEWR